MPNTLEDAEESLARRLLHYARPRQVQLVLRIAEAGAIQKAAAALGMSQPTATQSLTRLEDLLGVALFDRHARGVRLTRDGRLLLPALKRFLDSIEMLAHDAAHLGDGATGMVRIAGIAAATSALAAPALPLVCADYPGMWIDYREIDAAEIPALCIDDAADLVLCRQSVNPPDDYTFVALRKDRMGIYCASDDPVGRKRSLDLLDLRRRSWLVPPLGSPPHRAFLELCERRDLSPTPARFGTRELAVGVSLVCSLKLLYMGLDSHLGAYVDAGRLRRLPLDVPGSPDALGMLMRARPLPDAVQAVARRLKAWARN